MLIQQKLGLKLAQKPVLTQSLRQLVRLLALNRLELKEEISQELVENPVLEMEGEGDSDDGAGASGEESFESGEGLSENGAGPDSAAKDSAEGEAGEKDAFDEIDFEAFFSDYLDPGFRSPMSEIIDKPSFEAFLSTPTTLTGHLLWQLSLTDTEPRVAQAAETVIGNLNEDGYLTADLEEIAEPASLSKEEAERGLRLVQEFDPLGVGARDLKECLLIQLRDLHGDHELTCRIVSDHLEDLQDGGVVRVAEKTGCGLQEAERAVAEIRALDPKPGRQYGANDARTVEPDVYFVKTPQGFRVVLNEEDMPDLRLNRKYRRLLTKGGGNSREVRNYIKERYNSAIQLLRNIEQRRQTIRSVCEVIARRQAGFLANGLDHLRPMMIKEIAEEIGVHPSTVSRAVANKYGHTPHGVHELRFFFSEAVQGPSGGNIPLVLLKKKVKQMIAGEDAARPLTDDRLSQMLKAEGISVTRRTVAKYREDLGIPSTHKRRRRPASR